MLLNCYKQNNKHYQQLVTQKKNTQETKN